MFSDEQSPFDAIESYTAYLEPYLNTYYKEYQQIITLSKQPKGELAKYVRPIQIKPLSPFNQVSPLADPFQCTFAVLRSQHPNLKSVNPFLTKQDIPAFISFLKVQGYHVDMDIFKIINKSGLSHTTNEYSGGKKTMLCQFTYGEQCSP